MLEADALQSVRELHVDAEVVGVQLERVAGTEALVLLDVHHEPRDGAAVLGREVEAPVRVALGVGLEADGVLRGVRLGGHGVPLGQDRPPSK